MDDAFDIEIKARRSNLDETTGVYMARGSLTEALNIALNEFVGYELDEGNTKPERLIIMVTPVADDDPRHGG